MSILESICAEKRAHIGRREVEVPLAQIEKAARAVPPCRGFRDALLTHVGQGRPALIAEIKKASPSAGLIRDPFDPAELAQAYETGGASCLSILTDEPYFQGKDKDLIVARHACALPVLRKDFMLAPYQIYESRALGADCVLLIMAVLDDETAGDLYDLARGLRMDVLIEVHDRRELQRALALRADMIGVNSRNLKTMKVDPAMAFDLVKLIPDSVVAVAESGIKEHDELVSLQRAGFDAFLVGESLMKQPDVEKAVRNLLGTNLTANRN